MIEQPEPYESPLLDWWNKEIEPLINGSEKARIRKVYVKYEPGEEDWEFTRHSDGVMTWLAVF